MKLLLTLLTALAAAASPTAHAASDAPREAAHFHHVHLNVTDATRTRDFYKKFFGATEVAYRGRSPALFSEKSFLLTNTVKAPPASNDGTSLWHIGWSGVDGASEYAWRVADGIHVHTPLTTPRLPGVDPRAAYMYFRGPDGELVEVSTVNRNHRFEHVHLLASDIEATTDWFYQHLGLAASQPKAIAFHGVLLNVVQADNVSLVVFARPRPDRDNPFAAAALWPEAGFSPTDGRAVDHIAFSYRDITPVLQRMQAAGVAIVKDIAVDPRLGHKSFFVRGPDQLLVEIVEDRPIPEGVWMASQ